MCVSEVLDAQFIAEVVYVMHEKWLYCINAWYTAIGLASYNAIDYDHD